MKEDCDEEFASVKRVPTMPAGCLRNFQITDGLKKYSINRLLQKLRESVGAFEK